MRATRRGRITAATVLFTLAAVIGWYGFDITQALARVL